MVSIVIFSSVINRLKFKRIPGSTFSALQTIFQTQVRFGSFIKSSSMKINRFAAFFLLGLSLAACKKDDDTKAEEPNQQLVTQAEDNNELKSEGDQANTDVTDAMENYSTINGRMNTTKVICGCSIDSIGEKTIRLAYDGTTPCGNPSRTRGGTITFQLVQGNRWSQQGAKLNITLNNYKVTRLSDQKSWTFNGTKTLTNVRGTNWLAFLARTDSLLYRERSSNMVCNIAKDNNTATVTYNIARTTTWKSVQATNRSFIQFAAMGDTTIDGLTNVDTWGTGRFGSSFTNQFLERLLSDTYCQLWRPRGGKVQHKSPGGSITLTYGVNEQGLKDTRDCAYGWKVNWDLSNGAQGEKVISY